MTCIKVICDLKIKPWRNRILYHGVNLGEIVVALITLCQYRILIGLLILLGIVAVIVLLIDRKSDRNQ